MADSGEINSEDFLGKDILQAPLTLTKNIDVLIPKLNELIKVSTNLATTVKDEKTSINDLGKAAIQLNKIELDLVSTQKQAAEAVQKETSYLAAQDTTLNKLQQDYAKLRTEQERQSKDGKKLLDTIDKQNKKIKDLEKSLKDTKKAQQELGDAVSVLDSKTGGLIGKIKNLGSEFGALVKSPAILVLTALVGIFKTLQAAANSYYESSIQGEEALASLEDSNKAFFDAYRNEWLELGQITANYFQGLIDQGKEFLRWFQSNDTTKQQIENERELMLIEEERFALRNEHLRDQVDDANTELKVTQLLETAKDKESFTAKERLKALLEGNELLRQQEEGDIELAKRDLQIQKDIVQYESNKNKGKYDQTKSILDLTDQEIRATNVKFEDIKKLADLETALTKVESDASAKRVSRLKLELSTRKDVKDEAEKDLEFWRAHRAEFNERWDIPVKTALDKLKDFSSKATAIEVQGAEERMAAAKQELDVKVQYLETYSKARSEEVRLEEIQGKLEDIAQGYQSFYSALTTLSNTYTSNALQDIQIQQQAFEEHKANELKIAGDNEQAKEAIDNRYNALDKKLKHEQSVAQHKAAVFQKATSIIQAAIQESLLVIKALLTRSPLDIAAAIAGGVQVAAIASKQVPPAYKKGTAGTPKDEVAIVGEEGFEKITEPGKSPYLSPAKPTAVFLPKGTKVETHAQTMKSLATRGLSVDRSPGQLELAEISRALERQTQVIQDKPFVNVSITERGVRLELQRAARKEHRLGSLYS